MITLHNQSVFNPNKWNYTHIVIFTNEKVLFAIVHDVPSDLKIFADQVAEQEGLSVHSILEILPDGECVQSLNMTDVKYERHIAHSTAQAKRRAMVAPVESLASVI